MKSADLAILVQEGEGTTLEFKENLPASLARDLVAMANTIGGKILLGVRDDGTVVGVKDSTKLRARIQDIARNCDPPVKIVKALFDGGGHGSPSLPARPPNPQQPAQRGLAAAGPCDALVHP